MATKLRSGQVRSVDVDQLLQERLQELEIVQPSVPSLADLPLTAKNIEQRFVESEKKVFYFEGASSTWKPLTYNAEATNTETGLMSSLDKTRVNGFVFTQSLDSSTWTITHNLQKMPQVTVLNGAGEVCVGQITYIDSNQVKLTFSKAINGTAYLN